MIEVRNLDYTYPGGREEVLRGLNFSIEDGEILGFLGPSGAGKSTTQKTLIGLLKNYRGSITVLGRELSAWSHEYYEHIGVSFELPNHYLKLTALENLAYFRSLYSGPTNDPLEVLAWVGLADDAGKRVANFSKGMKVRLNVARSLLSKPKLLFLDEPTAGLDPVNARRIKNLVLEQRARGTTVFVTTHDMTVADELCDRVAFIARGRIDVIDAPGTLKKRYGKRSVVVEYVDGAGGPGAAGAGGAGLVEAGTGAGQAGAAEAGLAGAGASASDAAEAATPEAKRREFPLDGLGQNAEFIGLLNTARRVETIHTQETTLEEVFIKVTGEELSA